MSHAAPDVHESTQRPLPSHVPPGHAAPLGAKTSAGHVAVPPAQCSARSHAPADGRQMSIAVPVPVPGMHIGAGGVPVQTVVPDVQLPATTQ